MSASCHVDERAAQMPPYLLGVGTDDPWVEASQVTGMAEKLAGAGVPVEAFVVDGGQHEGSFWSQGVLARIERFLAAYL